MTATPVGVICTLVKYSYLRWGVETKGEEEGEEEASLVGRAVEKDWETRGTRSGVMERERIMP
jgi:hypothetical protein